MALSVEDLRSVFSGQCAAAVIRNPLVVSPETELIPAIAQTQTIKDTREQVPRLFSEPLAGAQQECLIVVEDAQVVGVVTPQAMIQGLLQLASLPAASSLRLQVHHVMTAPAITLEVSAFTDIFVAEALMQRHQIRYLPLVDEHGGLVGLITPESIRQVCSSQELFQLAEVLTQKVATLEVEQTAIQAQHTSDLETQIDNRTAALQAQAERKALLTTLSEQIRASLNSQDILDKAVTEIRALLACDRVIVYQLQDDFSGVVVAEAITEASRSVLHQEVHDLCVDAEWIAPYRAGQVRAVNDVFRASMTQCHQEMLTNFDIRAKLIAPIVVQEQLWGLMIASHRHHARIWSEDEIELMRQLAVQIAIALTQSATYQQLEQELQERQHIESLLLESEQRYASLAAAAPVGIYRMDVEGNCVYVNEHYCQITGLSPAATVGSGWQQSLHPEDRNHAISVWTICMQEHCLCNLEYRCQSGTETVWVYGQMTPERDAAGQVIGFVGTIIDISDRKQLELAVQQSQRQLRDVLDSAIAGIIRLRLYPDTSIQYDYISPYCQENFGYTAADLMNDPSIWRSRIHPQDWQRVVFPALQAMMCQQGPSVQVLEYRFYRQDGSPCWILAKCFAQWKEEGQYWHVTVVDADISDRKRTELALQQSEQTSRTIIETIPDLLIQMNREGRYSRMSGGGDVRVTYPAANSSIPEVYTALPSRLAEQRMDYTAKALETGQLQVYEQVIDFEEEQRYEEVRIAPLNDDEVLIIVRDVTEQKQAERQLQNLIEATAATTGRDFFPALVIHITEALGVSYAMVTETLDTTLRPIAVWANGCLLTSHSYTPKGTPCERVLTDGAFFCNSGIQQRFPEATELVEMEMESYLGVALHDTQGEVIGHLCIMNQRPITKLRRAEDLLRVFASRAAAELERQQAITSLERLNRQLEARVKERTAKLQEREQFLRTVLNTFPTSVFWKDRNSVYLGCNNNFLKDAGLTTVAELTGRTDYHLPWRATDADHYRADDRTVMESGIAKLGIIETQHQSDGSQAWLETNKLPLRNLEGEVVGVLGIYQDITERRRAEQELKESEERYRNIFNQASVGFANVSQQGQLLDVNLRFCELMQYSRAELLSKTVAEITHPDDIDLFTADQRSLFAEDCAYFVHEKRYIRKDGGYFWSSTSVSLVKDVNNVPTHTLAVIRDISERKQAEAQVQSLLRRTQLLNLISTEIRDSLELDIILESSVEAILTSLPADICNFAWYQETADRGRWEVVKEKKSANLHSWLGSYRSDEIPHLFQHILQNRIYQVNDLATLTDAPLRNFLREVGITLFLCVPIHTVGGKVGSLQIGRVMKQRLWQSEEIELLQDISNQVAIAIYQAQLYEESQAKTQEIERSYQELQEAQLQLVQSEKMSSLGQLVAGIAHEINNPMSFIYGNLNVASSYAADLSTVIDKYRTTYLSPPAAIQTLETELDIDYTLNDFPKLLKSMENGANRIRDIVKSLRIFSRLDRADCKAVDIHENIDSTLVILQNRLNGRAGKPEIEVVKQYGQLPLIECYSSLLNQVFMNLLVNAIDAVEERQKNASVAFSGQIIVTTAIAVDSKITILIEDNGIGMDLETQARIFDPFFTTKPVGLGTGMGLPISYQIVTGNHQGNLRCTSEPDKGTRFVVELGQSITPTRE